MLQNTFCHLSGISPAKEQALWSQGIQSWDAALEAPKAAGRKRAASVPEQIKESIVYLEENDPTYFADRLPSALQWRLFPHFRHSTAYLDIETTGLGANHSITTIALYDGESIFHYVQGKNLHNFTEDIKRYKLIVTYNGKTFDVPFIERYFNTRLEQAHIDLRYVLRRLGYSGGLKECERKLGIARNDLAEVDGYTAVLLWQDYKRNKNQKALETLLAYNILDVLNLEILLVKAYNENLVDTPFQATRTLPVPVSPQNPFAPDHATLNRILRY